MIQCFLFLQRTLQHSKSSLCMKSQELAWYFSKDFRPWASLVIFEGFTEASANQIYIYDQIMVPMFYIKKCKSWKCVFAFAASLCQETFQKSFRTVSKLTKKFLWPIGFQTVEKPTKKDMIFLFNFKLRAQTFLSWSSFWPFSSNFFGHKRKDPCVWVSAFSSSQVEISCCRFSAFQNKNKTLQTKPGYFEWRFDWIYI